MEKVSFSNIVYIYVWDAVGKLFYSTVLIFYFLEIKFRRKRTYRGNNFHYNHKRRIITVEEKKTLKVSLKGLKSRKINVIRRRG